MTFEQWFSSLKETAVRLFGFSEPFVGDYNAEDWRVYYEDGLSPSQALSEDLSNI